MSKNIWTTSLVWLLGSLQERRLPSVREIRSFSLYSHSVIAHAVHPDLDRRALNPQRSAKVFSLLHAFQSVPESSWAAHPRLGRGHLINALLTTMATKRIHWSGAQLFVENCCQPFAQTAYLALFYCLIWWFLILLQHPPRQRFFSCRWVVHLTLRHVLNKQNSMLEKVLLSV